MPEQEITRSLQETLSQLPAQFLFALAGYLTGRYVLHRHDNVRQKGELERLGYFPENILSPEHLKEKLGVFVLIFREGEKGLEVLLVKRKDYKNLWNLPGGGVEAGEEIFEAATREVNEETGLKVIIDKNTAYKWLDQPRDVDSDIPAERRNDRYIMMVGRVVGGEIKLNEEAAEIKFWPVDNLPESLYARHRREIVNATETTKETTRFGQAMQRSALSSRRYLEGRTPKTEAKLLAQILKEVFVPVID